MKTLKANLTFIVLLAIGLGSVSAQEYDDMYFSSKDRKQVKYVSDNKSVTQDLNEVQDITQDPSQNYSARTVNPEYIAKYQASSQEGATAEFADDEYFVEDYQNQNQTMNNTIADYQNNSDVAVRDRYGNVSYFRDYSDVYWSDPFLYQGTVFDPFYRSYGYGYGYRGYRPYRSGWSVSFGYSSGWLSGYSWSTPYSGWRYGFGTGYGYGGYGYDPFYCPPYYNSYYGNGYGYPYRNTVVINNYENRNDRSYRRGPGPSRSGVSSNNDGRRRSIVSNNDSNDGRVSTNGRSDASSNSRSRYIDNRDYDNAQSRYYRRSRTAISSDDSNSGRTYGNTSRSSSDTRSYTNRSSSSNRSSYDSRSSNNRRNSSYTRPSSNSRSNGYSPSRSSNNRSSVGSSNSSRSRSSSISSGSSRSSSSRSSGSSRSSSSSKSRRGNN